MSQGATVNRKKSTGIVASAALAVLGMLLVFTFIKGRGDSPAPDAAAAGAVVETVNVYKTKQAIPKGTDGATVKTMVDLVAVPKSELVPGASIDLDFNIDTIVSKITALPLTQNQQLTNALFESPTAAASSAIPPGQVAVTLLINADRMVGIGNAPDETVGVVATFQNGPNASPVVHHTLHKIRIIGRPIPYGIPLPTTVAGAPEAAPTAPAGALMQVTLAVTAADSERLLYMNQFGTIHLIQEPLSADEANTKLVQIDNVFVPTNGDSRFSLPSTTLAPATTVPATTVPAPAPTTVVAAAGPAPTTVKAPASTVKPGAPTPTAVP
jgi:pilus assembly protein CpaB